MTQHYTIRHGTCVADVRVYGYVYNGRYADYTIYDTRDTAVLDGCWYEDASDAATWPADVQEALRAAQRKLDIIEMSE